MQLILFQILTCIAPTHLVVHTNANHTDKNNGMDRYKVWRNPTGYWYRDTAGDHGKKNGQLIGATGG